MAADEPLPGILAEVEEIVGREKAIRLAIQLGGREMHIPHPDKLRADHPIVAVTGIRRGRKIAERFNGVSVYVPHARREITIYMVQQGRTVKEISDMLQTSANTIRKILRRA